MNESGDINESKYITNGVLSTKLDHLTELVKEVRDTVRLDHDRLGKVENNLEDFVTLKRYLLGYGVTLFITMSLALYAVLQHKFTLP